MRVSMDLGRFERINDYTWRIPQSGNMRVPGIIYASEALIREMDDKVYDQVRNVATLPGIVKASMAMPDAHWGYGFPIGGVAAFDPKHGVVSAGGVGFDISCGVRLIKTGLKRHELEGRMERLADTLFARIPAGVGSKSHLRLTDDEMDAMLTGGASWAVGQGYGKPEDLERIEERGRMEGADPREVSERARVRQSPEMGTLGSGNHYLEVQEVGEVREPTIAKAYGLDAGDVVISIHCGSRGLGHQIGTEYLKLMAIEAAKHGIHLPDRELACAPINSQIGRSYLGAMRSAINCALANRQILTQFTRDVFADLFPHAKLDLLYDVSHNTCKEEQHIVDGEKRTLFVHRKGATRAFGPGHPDLPDVFKEVGQPVIIGGSMGTGSYILAGTKESEALSFSSSCHGAGRAMSRTQATKKWQGDKVIADLKGKGILIRSPTMRGVAEEAPGAYKNLDEVVAAADGARISVTVVHLKPLICIKG